MTLTQLTLLSEPVRPVLFDGETFDRKLDGKRLARQLDKVRELMLDGQWRTLRQIADAIGCSESSASARLRDMRKAPPHGYGADVKRARDRVNKALWWYKLSA